MKHLTHILAILIMIAGLASCGSDSKDNPEPPIIITENLGPSMVKFLSMDSKVTNDAECEAVIDINPATSRLRLTLKNVEFPTKGQANSMVIDEIGFKEADKKYTITTTSAKGSNGINVSGIKGYFNTDSHAYVVEFTVDNNFKVVLTSQLNLSAKPSSTEKYYAFTHNFFKNKLDVMERNLQMSIYNVKFVEQMPTLKEMIVRVNDTDLTNYITSTPTGYTLKMDKVIPFYKEGNTETPMETRPMTNVKLEVNLVERDFSIEFDCFGLHYTDSGKLL
ncbi:MAG: hypothetical protein Q4E41_04540 [Bacteroidales bacterium]|nr:hypothetical protein [Bacteroidales bacterium]